MPELVVENPLAERVLLYDGEELVGAKQNRILNVSVLVEAKSTLTIPVSCVEQGRWRARLAPSSRRREHISHAQLRRRKAEAQAAQPLARGVAQSEVWDELHEKSLRMSVDSPTGASADIYRAHERDLRALEDAFPAQPGQCGAIFAIGDDVCLDARLATGRVRAPVAEAPRRLPARRARAARREADAVRGIRALPRGYGTRRAEPAAVGRARRGLRLRGEHVIGSGLELEGELIQLSAFRSEDGGQRAFGRIARPSRRR